MRTSYIKRGHILQIAQDPKNGWVSPVHKIHALVCISFLSSLITQSNTTTKPISKPVNAIVTSILSSLNGIKTLKKRGDNSSKEKQIKPHNISCADRKRHMLLNMADTNVEVAKAHRVVFVSIFVNFPSVERMTELLS